MKVAICFLLLSRGFAMPNIFNEGFQSLENYDNVTKNIYFNSRAVLESGKDSFQNVFMLMRSWYEEIRDQMKGYQPKIVEMEEERKKIIKDIGRVQAKMKLGI